MEPIQLAVVDCLLERVASLMEDDEELVLFALEQLKWLDRLVNGEVGACEEDDDACERGGWYLWGG